MKDIAELVRSIAIRCGAALERDPSRIPSRPEAPPAVLREQHRIEQRLCTIEAIPEEHRQMRLVGPELMEVIPWNRAAIEQVRKAPPAIVTTFVGISRSGKSTLATALYVSRIDPQRPVGQWVKAARIIAEATRECPLGVEPPALTRCRKTPLLLVDDLGQETESDAARTLLYDLLDERHAARRPTIVTTGLTKELLLKRYGAGMVERLTEKGRAFVVTMKPKPGGP